MIRSAVLAALLACTLAGMPWSARAQTQPQAQAPAGAPLPTVRLWTAYQVSDPSGALWGQAISVVTLCPSLVTTVGLGVAQICPGSSPANPLYVSGGGGTSAPTGPLGVAGAQSGGATSANPNTFTLILTSSPQRHGCVVQNTSSGVEYFFVGSNTPSIGSAIQVSPSGTYDCAHSNVVDQGDVRIASASPSAPFVMIAQ